MRCEVRVLCARGASTGAVRSMCVYLWLVYMHIVYMVHAVCCTRVCYKVLVILHVCGYMCAIVFGRCCLCALSECVAYNCVGRVVHVYASVL